MRRPRIVVLAQTPPPFHGQAVMQQYVASARWSWCTVEHIRLRYSERMEDVGRFSLPKVAHCVSVILRVWRARMAGPIAVLYYPPAGPHRIPFFRDVCTLLMTRWTSPKLVLHFHAGGFDRLGALLSRPERILARIAYGRARLAIVPSPALRAEVQWIAPRETISVPNGVPDIPGRNPRRPSASGLRILFAGTLTAEKGILDLLAAVRLLVGWGCRPEVIVAGAFRSRAFGETVLEFLHTANLQPSVRLVGVLEKEEMEMEYARAGIFCFPTRDTEAMPIVLLEAMREGLPIVTTQWRSLPEVVGPAAILVPPGDPHALASALRGLLGSEEQRHALGAAARRRYEQEFTLARHLEGMDKALRMAAG